MKYFISNPTPTDPPTPSFKGTENKKKTTQLDRSDLNLQLSLKTPIVCLHDLEQVTSFDLNIEKEKLKIHFKSSYHAKLALTEWSKHFANSKSSSSGFLINLDKTEPTAHSEDPTASLDFPLIETQFYLVLNGYRWNPTTLQFQVKSTELKEHIEQFELEVVEARDVHTPMKSLKDGTLVPSDATSTEEDASHLEKRDIDSQKDLDFDINYDRAQGQAKKREIPLFEVGKIGSMYCMDCYLSGNMSIRFKAKGFLTSKFETSFEVKGNTQLAIGWLFKLHDGHGESYSKEINLFEIPLTPYVIPGVISIGPMFILGTGISFTSYAETRFHSHFRVDLPFHVFVSNGEPKNDLSLQPTYHFKQLEAEDSLDVSLHVHLLPQIALGAKLFEAVNATVGIQFDYGLGYRFYQPTLFHFESLDSTTSESTALLSSSSSYYDIVNEDTTTPSNPTCGADEIFAEATHRFRIHIAFKAPGLSKKLTLFDSEEHSLHCDMCNTCLHFLTPSLEPKKLDSASTSNGKEHGLKVEIHHEREKERDDAKEKEKKKEKKESNSKSDRTMDNNRRKREEEEKIRAKNEKNLKKNKKKSALSHWNQLFHFW